MIRPYGIILAFCVCWFSASQCFSENLLQDPAFQNGFEVMSPFKDIYTDRAEFETIFRLSGETAPGKKNNYPVWRLVQWGSYNSIAKATAMDLPNGGKRWVLSGNSQGMETIYKSISLDNTSLTLELNALPEFASPQRRDKAVKNNSIYLGSSGEYWPHLLMAQNLNTPNLAKYKTLALSLDARLIKDEKNIREGYKRDMHAARFVVSMAVRNTLSKNSFWLNMVIYDDRYEQSTFICKKCPDDNADNCYVPQTLEDKGKWSCPFDGDRWSKTSEKKGTRRMIFRIPGSASTNDKIQNGQWAHYQVDLLPYIRAAMEAAQGNEKLRGFLPSLEYFNITLFSMGWEITGLNHAAMETRNLALWAEPLATGMPK